MSRQKKIKVIYVGGEVYLFDWYDLADWLKQMTLKQPVTIIGWWYV